MKRVYVYLVYMLSCVRVPRVCVVVARALARVSPTRDYAPAGLI